MSTVQVCKPRMQTHDGAWRWWIRGAAITHDRSAREEPLAGLGSWGEGCVRGNRGPEPSPVSTEKKWLTVDSERLTNRRAQRARGPGRLLTAHCSLLTGEQFSVNGER